MWNGAIGLETADGTDISFVSYSVVFRLEIVTILMLSSGLRCGVSGERCDMWVESVWFRIIGSRDSK